MQMARALGPALGGLLFGFAGPIVTSSLICIFLLAAGIVMLTIKKDVPAKPHSGPAHASVKDEFLSGIRFVFSHQILLPALALDMISVLFGGVTALLPIFAREILEIGPKGLGILRASPAVGAVAMSLILAKYTLRGRSGAWLMMAVGGFGISILVFGASHNYILSIVALIFSGAFDSISMLIRSAAVQLTSPDHMRGKISAVNSIFIGSSNELGEVESGIAAKFLGPINAVFFGGWMCLLTVIVIAIKSPTLRKMDLKNLGNQN
jgi:MFS family permease